MHARRFFVIAVFVLPIPAWVACGSDDSNEVQSQRAPDAALTDASTTSDGASPGDAATTTDGGPSSDASDAAVVPTKVVSGQFHSCALTNGGDVYCWGGSQAGQLGIAADANAHPNPVKIALSNVVDIAAGGSFNCARLSSGVAECWGDDATHQLGHDGGADTACATNFSGQACNPTPTAVADLANVTELALGYQHACALTSDGGACWGDNVGGQGGHATGSDPLCNGFCTATPTPIAPAVPAITDIGAGLQVSFVITSGNVLAFGSNGGGLLGGPIAGPTPTSNGATNAVQLATGALANHSCALQTGMAATCWGENSYGVVSLTSNGAAASPPTAVPVTNVIGIGVGTSFTCVVRSGGTVQCWGLNDGGQLGHDPSSDPMVGGNPASITPTDVVGVSNAVAISVGSSHACATTATGDVKCWGHGEKGQNGSAGSANAFAPSSIVFPL